MIYFSNPPHCSHAELLKNKSLCINWKQIFTHARLTGWYNCVWLKDHCSLSKQENMQNMIGKGRACITFLGFDVFGVIFRVWGASHLDLSCWNQAKICIFLTLITKSSQWSFYKCHWTQWNTTLVRNLAWVQALIISKTLHIIIHHSVILVNWPYDTHPS